MKRFRIVENTGDSNYWAEVDKYKIPLEKGPVVIGKQ